MSVERLQFGQRVCAVQRMGHGPRLVLLHGGPGLDHHVLLPLAEALADAFEVWLPDLPGHGETGDDSPRLSSLYQHMADWLQAVPGGVEFLAGHSLGAWVARELLRRRALTPRAAVLLAPPAVDPRARADASETGLLTSSAGSPEEARAEFLEALRAETVDEPSEEFLEALAHARFRRPTAYGPLLRDLLQVLTRPPAKCQPACPVLVLGGREDRTVPPGAVAAIASATEGATLKILRDSGHVPWMFGADEVASIMRRFLLEPDEGP